MDKDNSYKLLTNVNNMKNQIGSLETKDSTNKPIESIPKNEAMNTGPKVNLPRFDIESVNECLKVINAALNKGAKIGAYTIDDSYLIKISMNNLEKAIGGLKEYQNFLLALQDAQTKI